VPRAAATVFATSAETALNAALSLAGIERLNSLPERITDFFETAGSRAWISCSMPFARTDEPRVAAGESAHVLSSSTSLFSFF
jgi:hypothetical protein